MHPAWPHLVSADQCLLAPPASVVLAPPQLAPCTCMTPLSCSSVAQVAQLAMRGRLLQLHGKAFALVGGFSSSAGNARSPAAAAREGIRFGRWFQQLSWQWAVACCSCMGRSLSLSQIMALSLLACVIPLSLQLLATLAT